MVTDAKENLHQEVYKTIRQEGNISLKDFSPNIIINKGKYEFYGYDAERLILYSADAINLPRDYFAEYFPYGEYFEPEGNPWLMPLAPILLIAFLFISFYRKMKNIILYLFNRPTIQYETNSNSPLTARQFADIMIEFLEQYQRENKK